MSGAAPAGYNPASTLPLPNGGGPDIVAIRGGGKGDDVAISGSGFPNDGVNPVLRYDITKKQYMIVVTKGDGSKYAIYDVNLGTLQTRALEVAEGSYTPSVSGALPSAPSAPVDPLETLPTTSADDAVNEEEAAGAPPLNKPGLDPAGAPPLDKPDLGSAGAPPLDKPDLGSANVPVVASLGTPKKNKADASPSTNLEKNPTSNNKKGGKKTRKQKLRKNKRATRYLS